jgi:hypothetical protein
MISIHGAAMEASMELDFTAPVFFLFFLSAWQRLGIISCLSLSLICWFQYNMYSDEFEVSDGVLTAAAIDEEYCLTDAMPGCLIHLSRISTEEFTKLSQDPELQAAGFEVRESSHCAIV